LIAPLQFLPSSRITTPLKGRNWQKDGKSPKGVSSTPLNNFQFPKVSLDHLTNNKLKKNIYIKLTFSLI